MSRGWLLLSRSRLLEFNERFRESTTLYLLMTPYVLEYLCLPKVQFGSFRFCRKSRRLTDGGVVIRLAPKQAQILDLLLAQPGAVVRRELLRGELWADGTQVEFESGLNSAIHRLRRAFNDSAERPCYIETIPRVGYRFIYPAKIVPSANEAQSSVLGPADTAWSQSEPAVATASLQAEDKALDLLLATRTGIAGWYAPLQRSLVLVGMMGALAVATILF